MKNAVAFVVLATTVFAALDERCKTFCSTALKHCTGDDASYDSMAECHEKCPTFPRTQTTPYRDIQGGDSLPCREFWLSVVEKMKEKHGSIAPGTCDYLAQGGGMCDNSVSHECEAYCGQIDADGDCGRGPWNMKHGECLQACKGFKNDPKLTDSIRGDSLQCRIYYINVGEQSKYPNAKQAFCPFAGKASTMCKEPPAGHDSCTDYCDLNAKFCKSSEGGDKCLSYCRALSPEAKACHLRYVAIAGRCTSPEIPCHHRQVCNEGKDMAGLGFETAKLEAPPKQAQQRGGAAAEEEEEPDQEENPDGEEDEGEDGADEQRDEM